jgi:NADPH-dependent 2,4-dienoyl-CoA reductase/sulfur reductase-like enzyme
MLPDLPGFDLPEVMALKSLEHGKKIKSFIREKNIKKAVIVGMGYIGLEMCEALTKRSVMVDMVKPRPVFLPWMTSDLADVIKEELKINNINIYPGHEIKKIESKAQGVSVVCDDFSLDADLVLAASGVKPESGIAVDAGLATGISGAISVDSTLLTSDKNIYAAGDCADAIHVVTNKKCWIPLALRANRAGWAVADNVCGVETKLKGVAGTAVFKVFSLEVARTGLSVKEAVDAGFDPVEVFIKTRSKAHGQPGSATIHVSMTGDKKTGRLIGVQMVGKEGVAHRINAASVALHTGMTVEDFSQTDLAYAPPFGPVWDPLLTAANQLIKKL